MEAAGEGLIAYQGVIKHLQARGRGKNFFDTLRTRYGLIHKPIIRPPVTFSVKEVGIKYRKGRSVFYLKQILPFLDEIMEMHDKGGLYYDQIARKMKQRKQQLDALRKLELAGDNRLKPREFVEQFKIAVEKLNDYFGWTDKHSKDKQFLDYILEQRSKFGAKYYELTEILREMVLNDGKIDRHEVEDEREACGKNLDYYDKIMETVITHFKQLLDRKKIIMTADDWSEVSRKVGGA